MTLDAAERDRLIEQYATGPKRLREALAKVPPEAMRWRPEPGEFSVHEIVVHCADSETNAAARIRYLMAEADPVILGYDPDNWASRFDYHSHPLEAALATLEAVRANTTPLARRLDAASWDKAGTHSESGRYTGNDWLQIYSRHLEEHVDQIERTVAAWRAAGCPVVA
ncbi:MAG TPA: DinB family protein [Dehalococcoidia bacterium]|nr:DinB family protein [Dehalococcoidia bacterium]